MIVGSFVVATCLLVLGWTTEIVNTFVKDAEKVLESMRMGFLTSFLFRRLLKSSITPGQKRHHRASSSEYLRCGLCY